MRLNDPYKTLQVDPEAEFEVIEAAYRRLARKYHPDISDTPEARERMVALNGAWEQLRDPVRRAAVDQARARAAAAERLAQASPASQSQTRDSPHGVHVPAHQPRTTQRFAPHGTASTPGDGSLRAAAQPRAGDAARNSPQPPSSRTARVMGGVVPGAPDGWAGPPPGPPWGSVLNFGRYTGWSLGEVARRDPAYLEWLERSPIGRPFKPEVQALLRTHGRRGRS